MSLEPWRLEHIVKQVYQSVSYDMLMYLKFAVWISDCLFSEHAKHKAHHLIILAKNKLYTGLTPTKQLKYPFCLSLKAT